MNSNSTRFKANFSGTTSGFPSSTRVPRELAITVIAFVTVSILAALAGNTRVCILLRRRRDLRKVPHYLLGNLAVSGVFSSLFSMPLLIIMTIVNYFGIRDMLVVEILCKVGLLSQFAYMVVNALTLWLMAFDRLDCVLHPFNRRLTIGKAKKLIAVTWISGLITTVLFAISIGGEPSVCTEFYPYNKDLTQYGGFFSAALTVVGQFDKITVLIVIVTFFRIKKAFRSSSVSPTNSSHQRREKKLTSLTYKLCGVFLLFRGLVIISHLYMRVGFQITMTAKIVRLVTYAMMNFVYVANPILHRKILTSRWSNQLVSWRSASRWTSTIDRSTRS